MTTFLIFICSLLNRRYALYYIEKARKKKAKPLPLRYYYKNLNNFFLLQKAGVLYSPMILIMMRLVRLPSNSP